MRAPAAHLLFDKLIFKNYLESGCLTIVFNTLLNQTNVMKDFEISIGGKKYPCRITLRAMLKFKQVTGRDWGQLDGNGVSDMIVFLWCCVWAASMTDGVDFPYDLEEFAGNVDGGVFGKWTAYMGEVNSETEHQDEGGKKKARQSKS